MAGRRRKRTFAFGPKSGSEVSKPGSETDAGLGGCGRLPMDCSRPTARAGSTLSATKKELPVDHRCRESSTGLASRGRRYVEESGAFVSFRGWRGVGPRVRAPAGAIGPVVVWALIAAGPIDLIIGEDLAKLRACAAPGRLRLLSRDHPRGMCCSTRCGHRVRASRYYRAHRRQPPQSQ